MEDRSSSKRALIADSGLIRVAAGDAPADLIIRNANIVNVFSREILPGHIAISGGRIAGVGDYEAKTVIDVQGRYAAPGFIDAHVHIESAMVSVSRFVQAVLPRGTTTVAADPHEIANVLGAAGIDYMLASARNQPMNIFFMLPSCVPATDMETAGARLDAAALEPYLDHEEISGLGEMMNYPGVVAQDKDVLAKIAGTHIRFKRVDGHAPALSGKSLNAYLAAGISSDHECVDPSEALEKLRAGMHIMIREGTGAKNLKDLLPVITEKNASRFMWCTDDRHPHDICGQGHIDHMIREAVRLGLDPVIAIQMATINPARYFGLHAIGAVAPGRRADLVIFPDLKAPAAEQVFCGGRLVAEGGRMRPEVEFPPPADPAPAMHVDPASFHFEVLAAGKKIRVIDLVPGQILTRQVILKAGVKAGQAVADVRRDLLKLAVVERHQGSGRVGVGFVRGFGFKNGAVASSVAHDSHNIIVVGSNDADMKTAVQAIVHMKGGLCAVSNGEVRARLPLPIAGLMSNKPMDEVRSVMDDLLAAAREMGSAIPDPFMALSFLALPVIPELRLTDRGLFDVGRFAHVPVFVK